MILTILKFALPLLIIASLVPILLVYIAGDAVVHWCSCAVELWRECRKTKFRLVLVLLLVLVLEPARAGEVTLAWDASPSPAVTNYVLYAHTNALSATNLASALVKVNAGTNLTALVENLRPPTTWYFVCTAVAGGVQSDPSNQLIVQVPVAPANQRVLAVQFGVTLTNFTDTGFFRLRIPAP